MPVVRPYEGCEGWYREGTRYVRASYHDGAWFSIADRHRLARGARVYRTVEDAGRAWDGTYYAGIPATGCGCRAGHAEHDADGDLVCSECGALWTRDNPSTAKEYDRITSIFREEVDRFGLKGVGLGVKTWKQHGRRNVAQADTRERVIWVHPAALTRTSESLRALVRHELAHLVDPVCSERETDRIAELMSGEPIYYGKDGVQTTVPGSRPRPKHLPR